MTTRILLVGLVLLGVARGVSADDGDHVVPGEPPLARSPSAPDFLLHPPHAWLALNGAFVVPRAGGDLFSFFHDQLTVDGSRFRSKAIGVELGIALNSHVDIVGGLDSGRSSTGSEYRHYTMPGGAPIEQTTKLSNANISLGARYSLVGRGRRLSRFAFVPRRISPFVGGGLAMGHYSLVQSGQFVDFEDLGIFNHYFASSGWGSGGFVNGGADVQLWRALFLKIDGKYTWLRSPLQGDFVGFDHIDLSGFRSSTGLSVVF